MSFVYILVLFLTLSYDTLDFLFCSGFCSHNRSYTVCHKVMMVTHGDLISFVNLFCILELAPTVATYYGNRSAAFMMLGTYDKALEDAQNAVRIDENFLKVCWYVILKAGCYLTVIIRVQIRSVENHTNRIRNRTMILLMTPSHTI